MRSRHRELEGVLLFHMGGLVARDLTCPALASKLTLIDIGVIDKGLHTSYRVQLRNKYESYI